MEKFFGLYLLSTYLSILLINVDEYLSPYVIFRNEFWAMWSLDF